LFNSKQALFEDSIDSLAELLQISRQTLCDKRDGKSEFKRDEIAKLSAHWQLTHEEIVEMFSLNEGINDES
jgi:hypothetical protein